MLYVAEATLFSGVSAFASYIYLRIRELVQRVENDNLHSFPFAVYRAMAGDQLSTVLVNSHYGSRRFLN